MKTALFTLLILGGLHLAAQPGEYITDHVRRELMASLLLSSSKYYPIGDTTGFDVQVVGFETAFTSCCDTVFYGWIGFDSLYVAPFIQVIRPGASAKDRPFANVEEYTNTWARVSLTKGTDVLIGGQTTTNSAHADNRLAVLLIGKRQ